MILTKSLDIFFSSGKYFDQSIVNTLDKATKGTQEDEGPGREPFGILNCFLIYQISFMFQLYT